VLEPGPAVTPTDAGVEVTEGELVRWQPTTIAPNTPVDGLFLGDAVTVGRLRGH
jgi:hypothetical protein